MGIALSFSRYSGETVLGETRVAGHAAFEPQREHQFDDVAVAVGDDALGRLLEDDPAIAVVDGYGINGFRREGCRGHGQ